MNNIVIIIGFIGFGVFLTLESYTIGNKKRIEKISCINEKRRKKIKKVDKVAKDYSDILNLMSLGCYLGAILTVFFGTPIGFIGLIPLLWGSFMLSGFAARIDEKIKNRIY